MYYSYVMGIDRSIHNLTEQGFMIQPDGENYMVTFPAKKADVWENFVAGHLEKGFWNEYLAGEDVIFLFHLEEGIKRYRVRNYWDREVLKLCEKLCQCQFESLRSMLEGNHFYRSKLSKASR